MQSTYWKQDGIFVQQMSANTRVFQLAKQESGLCHEKQYRSSWIRLQSAYITISMCTYTDRYPVYPEYPTLPDQNTWHSHSPPKWRPRKLVSWPAPWRTWVLGYPQLLSPVLLVWTLISQKKWSSSSNYVSPETFFPDNSGKSQSIPAVTSPNLKLFRICLGICDLGI